MVKLIKEVIHIAVCDDEIDALKQMLDVLESKDYGIEIKLYPFCSGENLLSSIEEIPYLNYIFLDIILEGMSGIDVARKILEKRPDIQIIFVSNSNDYRMESKELGAFHYYLKSENENLIPQDLSYVVEEFIRSSLFVRAKSKDLGIIDIPVSEIIYVEIYSRMMNIVTTKGIEYCAFDEALIQHLGSYYDFGFSRQNTVVNFSYIKDLRNGIATLSNGCQLDIVKRRYKDFKDKYNDYKTKERLDFKTKKVERIGRYRFIDIIRLLD